MTSFPPGAWYLPSRYDFELMYNFTVDVQGVTSTMASSTIPPYWANNYSGWESCPDSTQTLTGICTDSGPGEPHDPAFYKGVLSLGATGAPYATSSEDGALNAWIFNSGGPTTAFWGSQSLPKNMNYPAWGWAVRTVKSF